MADVIEKTKSADPQTERGHWRCIFRSSKIPKSETRQTAHEDGWREFSSTEHVGPYRFATKEEADLAGPQYAENANAQMDLQGVSLRWTYLRAEFFPEL